MKKGQKYVVQCIKSVAKSKVGLGSKGNFPKSHYVKKDGGATKSIDKAFVYTKGNQDFPFDDDFTSGFSLSDYFCAVPCSIQPPVKPLEKVKFITKEFGTLPEGTVIDIYCLAKSETQRRALLFHPSNEDECGCLIFAERISEGVYKDTEDPYNYINITKHVSEQFENFLKNTEIH